MIRVSAGHSWHLTALKKEEYPCHTHTESEPRWRPLAVVMLGACQDAQMPTEADVGLTPDAPLMQLDAMEEHTAPRLVGRTIQNIQFDAVLEDGVDGQFVGRIVNLDFALNEAEDGIVASGRIIGQILDGDGNVVERINQAFEDFDVTGLIDNGNDILNGNNNGVTQILFLELGPLFVDLLGLVIEIPDPIILEIRAEEGPGQLLGNLLVALLGILD